MAAREEILEGGVQRECGDRVRVCDDDGIEREWVSREGVSASESKTARTASLERGDRGGSHRTASMYFDCGILWICVGFWTAVIAIVSVLFWRFFPRERTSKVLFLIFKRFYGSPFGCDF